MDTTNNQGKRFYMNEIVWGKIQGHPWWPGIITLQEQKDGANLYRVDFLGTQPTQYCSYNAALSCQHIKSSNMKHLIKKRIKIVSLQNSKTQKTQNNNNSCFNKNTTSIPSSHELLLNPDNQNCSLIGKIKKMGKNQNEQENINIMPQFQKIRDIEEIKVPKKRGRKPKKLNNQVQYLQVQKLHGDVNRCKKQKMQKLLEQYRLHQIPVPSPEKQMSKHQQSLICRKIQKILKFSGFQPKRRYELALELQHKLKSISDFTQLIQQLKKGSSGLAEIKKLQEENPNQTLSSTL